MHEISLCENILNLIEQQAEERHFSTVKRVYLEVGALSGVEVEALRFGFEVVMHDTIAGEAKLVIVDVAGEAHCEECGSQVSVRQRFDPCPNCGSYGLKITAGDGLYLKELEVD